jgi:hypothetical protein
MPGIDHFYTFESTRRIAQDEKVRCPICGFVSDRPGGEVHGWLRRPVARVDLPKALEICDGCQDAVLPRVFV